MAAKRIILPEFVANYQFTGNWEIAYTDPTHLPDGTYINLGRVAFDLQNPNPDPDCPLLPFAFEPATAEFIKTEFEKLEKDPKQVSRAVKIIREQITESLVRVGMLRPVLRLMENRKIVSDFPEILGRLSAHRYLIIVVDTGAARRGSVSFLHHVLPNVMIWTVIPVFLMTELFTKVKNVSGQWRNVADKGDGAKTEKCGVLENRPSVSCIATELLNLHAWRPVELLTTPPELLLGQKDNDRLIIESVKQLKRERGLHDSVYLLTGDKDMASLASLESVNTLFIGNPLLPVKVSSLRFDSTNISFRMSAIQSLLWDLTQVFSTIRFTLLATEQARQLELRYYCDARENFFANDVLEVTGD